MRLADKETRFKNYTIDTLGFTAIIIIHAFVLDDLLHLIPDEGSFLLTAYFVILYFGYHFLFEYFLGRTPGKFFTKTMVVDGNGNKPDVKAILLRNICRLIPFDNVSFLFGRKGWHDNISETAVIYTLELHKDK